MKVWHLVAVEARLGGDRLAAVDVVEEVVVVEHLGDVAIVVVHFLPDLN